jgi:hypothetical protein
MKSNVYRSVDTEDELLDHIIDVIGCIKECQATRHVLTRLAKCIDVDGAIFENALY